MSSKLLKKVSAKFDHHDDGSAEQMARSSSSLSNSSQNGGSTKSGGGGTGAFSSYFGRKGGGDTLHSLGDMALSPFQNLRHYRRPSSTNSVGSAGSESASGSGRPSIEGSPLRRPSATAEQISSPGSPSPGLKPESSNTPTGSPPLSPPPPRTSDPPTRPGNRWRLSSGERKPKRRPSFPPSEWGFPPPPSPRARRPESYLSSPSSPSVHGSSMGSPSSPLASAPVHEVSESETDTTSESQGSYSSYASGGREGTPRRREDREKTPRMEQHEDRPRTSHLHYIHTSPSEIGRKAGDKARGATQAALAHPMFTRTVHKEPEPMTPASAAPQRTEGGRLIDEHGPVPSPFPSDSEATDDEEDDGFAVSESPGATQSLAPAPRARSPEANDSFAICDSPGATQSLAPQPSPGRTKANGDEATEEPDEFPIMDSPSNTQSINPAQMPQRRSETMSSEASDPQVFDSPSNTQSIVPGQVLRPEPQKPAASATKRPPRIVASPDRIAGAAETEYQMGGEADDDDDDGLETPVGRTAPFKLPAPVRHPVQSMAKKVSEASDGALQIPLPHRKDHNQHQSPSTLAPRPPPRHPSTPSTHSNTSFTSQSSMATSRSSNSSPGTTSEISPTHQGRSAAKPKKMWAPPQHPDIVKQRGGGQRLIKETLDAHTGRSEEGQRMVNQYIFRTELGRGSFGAVQLAQDAETGRECAIKVFSKARLRRKMRQEMARKGPENADASGSSEEADPLYLIRNEVAIMKKVQHPNVVALYEVLDVEGEDNLYLVMELLRGGSVMKIQPGEEGAALDIELARRYFRQMVVGVDYLHQNEIIHHDIKPDNILLTSDRKTCKIADFGVSAMFVRPGDDTSLRSMGSPAFASPELCGRHSAADHHISGRSSDIWAMGVTLYCMVTGQLPFGRDGQIVHMYEEIKEAAPPIPEDWDPPLNDLMLRLLDKDQESRIKMSELREHPWVTSNGLRPLPQASENSKPVGPITEADMRHSFRHAISNSVQGFFDVLEASIAQSKRYGETHERGRRREFFKAFYREISARSAAQKQSSHHSLVRPSGRPSTASSSTSTSKQRF